MKRADLSSSRGRTNLGQAGQAPQMGQAMVEFVFILTILMIMVSGSLYFFRLNLYQFWAQQEARYLAFEQTWVPKAYYDSGNPPALSLLDDNAETFRRPALVSGINPQRSDEKKSTEDLLPALFGKLGDSTPAEEPAFFGSTAYASQRTVSWDVSNPRDAQLEVPPSPLPELDNALERRLRAGGFGEKFCTGARAVMTHYNYRPATTQFAASNCPATQERKLAVYLATERNIQDIFREFADRVDAGEPTGEAIQGTLERTVAEGFYSMFKNEVQSKFGDAPMEILTGRANAAMDSANSSITRMLTDLRYIGSTAAIAAILAESVVAGTSNPNNRNSITEFNTEKGITDILHVDAANILPVIGDGYLLNPMYLPVPPKFGRGAQGFFNGTMRAVLSIDGGDVQPRMFESVKKVSVTYDSTGGLFPAAVKRFKTGATLTANVLVDTDPWHIERRTGHTGPYREKGGEFDSTDDDTDEGVLRRGVMGLWLFPTPPDAFFDPILGFIGLDALSDLVSAFRPVGSFIAEIKNLIFNNPLIDLMNALSELPIIGSIFPKFPVWPVARPDAYPHSVEMEGDKKMKNSRNFQDYIDEQRDHNPEPNPEFN